MDLKLEEVANLLNVSESTVRRWLDDGQIPAYKLQDEYRFNRTEVEDWIVRNEYEDEGKHPSGGVRQYALYRAIHKGGVFHNVTGNTKEELIRSGCQILSKNLKFDPDMIADLMLDREKLMPTALNHGIAVPHTREISFNTHYDAVGIIFPEKPIDCGALDKEPVHTFFFLFACDDRRHLNLLAKIAHLSRDPEILKFLRSKPVKNDILSRVRSWESSL